MLGATEAPVVMVGSDVVEVEQRLLAGELVCPCGGGLAPWGYARARSVRGVGDLRPRRARCRACLLTHVLLAVSCLLRRADGVEVIGAALLAKASGAGHRRIAVRLERPVSTVRGWLRGFARNAEVVRSVFTGLLVALDPLTGPLAVHRSVFADAVEVVGVCAGAARRRLGVVGAVSPWQQAAAVTNGCLLVAGRQHLENRHIFEHNAIPPVLYLGESASVNAHLHRAGITLLTPPGSLYPKGDAAYLHALFELVVTSPKGQLAPLQLRAHHLAQSLRQAAYIGCGCSLLTAIMFGQADFLQLIHLHNQEKFLQADLQHANYDREQLAARISATGMDPKLVSQATKFAEREMDTAPTPASLLQFTANAIADAPRVRIKSLTYRFPNRGESFCQGHTVIDLPLINKKFDLPLDAGSTPADSDNSLQRFTELQFSILLTSTLPPAELIEIKKHISAALKAGKGVQLMLDPAAFSLINTLKGGFGMDTAQTENLWCMSIPWQLTPSKELP